MGNQVSSVTNILTSHSNLIEWEDDMKCGLCDREILEGLASKHHLIPKCKGGKETTPLHVICHSKIHSVFSEGQLANVYNSIEMMLTNEDIQNFVRWVRKKPADFTDRNIMSNVHPRKKRK